MIAVGIIGDISRALGDQSAQYAGAFMNVLLENLQSNILNRNVKISILSSSLQHVLDGPHVSCISGARSTT
jgi:hypothetical protein